MLDCLQSVLLMCTAYIVQHILMRRYLFSHLLQHSCLQYWHAVIYLRSAVSFCSTYFTFLTDLSTPPHRGTFSQVLSLRMWLTYRWLIMKGSSDEKIPLQNNLLPSGGLVWRWQFDSYFWAWSQGLANYLFTCLLQSDPLTKLYMITQTERPGVCPETWCFIYLIWVIDDDHPNSGS